MKKMKKIIILILAVFLFASVSAHGAVRASYWDTDNNYPRDFSYCAFSDKYEEYPAYEAFVDDHVQDIKSVRRGRAAVVENKELLDIPVVNYGFEQGYFENRPGRTERFYKYTPYFGGYYELFDCYNYPPANKLFYIKCP